MTVIASPVRALPGAPALSVVIASVNGWDLLGPTLGALDAQPERDRIEVIVIDAVGGDTRDRLLGHRPAVEVIPVDARLPIPRLRYLGVQKARGAIIAILEDHGAVAPEWAREVLSLHREAWGAVGGTVENGRDGLVNWAAFFCEYTPYMGPVAEGDATDLPGNNIAFKRPHLLRHARALDDGKWESWITDRLRADGVPLATSNRMPVRHLKPFRLGHFLVQRFHFSRSYAGMRRVDQSPGRRLVYGFGSSILPPLLLLRVARNALRKRASLARFAACLPLIGLFLTVGAFGEMIGYLVGPGDSLARVE